MSRGAAARRVDFRLTMTKRGARAIESSMNQPTERAADDAAEANQFIRYVLRIAEALSELGFDPAGAYSAAGLDAEAARDPHGRITFPAYCGLVRYAIDELGVPNLGLHVGRRISPLDHGLLGYAIVASSTLGRAILRVERFAKIMAPPFLTEVDLEEPQPQIRMWMTTDVPDDLRHYFWEEALGAWLQLGSELVEGPPWRPQIELTVPPPDYAADYARILGVEVGFDAPQTRMLIDPADLTRPFVHSNREAVRMFEAQCETILQRMTAGDALIERVRSLVVDRIMEPIAFEDIAARMAVGERTLRRGLAENGTSFRDIVLDVRMTAACEYLRTSGAPIDEISYLVGYSNPTNFYRAFQKWARETPSEYRRRALRP
jgi:AraC-like DNA-binding protein